MNAVLDAWAVMTLVKRDVGADRVRRAIAGGGARMCSVNLGEVHYVTIRTHGSAVARDQSARIRAAVAVEDPDWELVCDAAKIKAKGGLSYADAFCVATARRHAAPLLTGDSEIVESAEGVDVVDLRSVA